MPSRRATRHVERIRIEKEDVKKPVPEVESAPEIIEEDLEEFPEIIFEEFSEENSQTSVEKKPRGKRIRNIIFAVIAVMIIAAVAVGIVLCLLKEKKSAHSRNYMDQLRNQEITITEEEKINTFFRTYYDALSTGDTTILEGMFDDPSKANVSAAISTIVENYENIQVYITEGINENEYAVFVSNDIKFQNINMTAPSVDCYYLVKDAEEGTYLVHSEMYDDPEIIRFLRLVSYLQPIRTLMSDTDARLESALNSDKDLQNLYIVMQSMTDAVLVEENGE